MTQQIDLRPASARLVHLVEAVPDDALAGPTPCAQYSVGDLLDHIGGFALAFVAAAEKHPLGPAQPGDADNLEAGWRARIAKDLNRVGEAWSEPDAWTGMTGAGGVDLPGDVAGKVALGELVVHGWDLAVSTGQPADYDGPGLPELFETTTFFRTSGIEGIFGPEVAVPEDAPLLDRTLGVTGRDPKWATPRR